MDNEIVGFYFKGLEDHIYRSRRVDLQAEIEKWKRFHGLRYDAEFEYVFNLDKINAKKDAKPNSTDAADAVNSNGNSGADKPKSVRKAGKDTGNTDELTTR